MSTPCQPPSPAPDAAVVRTGRRALLTALPGCVLLTACGGAAVTGLARWLLGETRPSAGGLVGVALLLALGALGVVSTLALWRNRHRAIAVDTVGLWLDHSGVPGRRLIPWTSLAAVGVYHSRVRTRQYSLELCPDGPMDERDPVLWPLIREEEPPRAGLPRLRYRVPVPHGARRELIGAVRACCPPHLWFGEEERRPGHLGRPDVRRRPDG